MRQGVFLPDLWDRLAFEVVRVPPLRERRGDIMLLARHFLREFGREVPAIGDKPFSADAVAGGKIDVAIVWGPAAGYFVVHQAVPMEMTPIPSGKGDLPFAFAVSMGVRRGDDALRARVQKAVDAKAPEIRKILKEYGVPIVEQGAQTK